MDLFRKMFGKSGKRLILTVQYTKFFVPLFSHIFRTRLRAKRLIAFFAALLNTVKNAILLSVTCFRIV